MNYTQAIDYLFSRLPMFHRIGKAAYKANLDNTLALSNILGNPEQKFKCIHIAGTNGKGSTSHYLCSIMQEAGYKTGLFTSPHLKDFRERITINGKKISKKEVCNFITSHIQDFEEIQPSFFEWTFALASWYFAKEQVDIAILETGMGGRLDSTNISQPILSVITNIGLDHVQFLGNTLAAIATEKAGIIKPAVPVVIGETHPETRPVFIKFSHNLHSPISFADNEVKCLETSYTYHRKPLLKGIFYVENTKETYNIISPLTGRYQLKNIATVLCAAEILQQKDARIEKKHIINGIRKVDKNALLMGRWQTIADNPLTIADIGHNTDGIDAVLEQLSITPYKNLHIVMGVVNDKDVEGMLAKMPEKAVYYFCKADIPRGLDAHTLLELAKAYNLKGKVYKSVKEALLAAQKAATKDDLVFVGGSAFVVAEVV